MTGEKWPEAPLTPPPTVERYRALRAEVVAQGKGQAPDKYMRAFYQRCDIEFNDQEFIETVWEYLERNPDDTPTYSANKLFRAVQYEVIPVARPDYPSTGEHDHSDPSYPRGRHKPEAWDDAFRAIQSPFGRFLFRQHLIRDNIQTNVAQRGSVLKVAAQLFGIEKAKIYSGGASMGHIEKLMALFDDNTFSYPKVSVGVRNEERVYGMQKSQDHTHKFGQLLRNRTFRVHAGVLDDLGTPKFTAFLDWARSCSFRPNEFLNPKHRSLVQRLIETDVPQLKFLNGSFALSDHPAYLRETYPRWKKDTFNMAIFSTSLYQCSGEERDQALKNALELTADDGIIAVLDFVHLDDEGNLEFVPNWRDWDYNLYVLDKADIEKGWQHTFGIREGRVREVVLGKDVGRIAFGAMR